MRSRLATILGAVMVVALAFVWNSCGTQPGCPTCGTTTSGAYGVIDVVPVPEHNPTGEPGGPFNSFDISWFDPNQRVVYTSDRIGLDVVVTSTTLDEAVNTIGGLNEVAEAGNNGSPCIGPNTPAAGTTSATTPIIPSIITGQGAVRDNTLGVGATNDLTRFGCRNPGFFNSFSTFFPGFGPNGFFGGFPGAQCCAARANGVNPLSGPNGLLVTPDGKTLFVGSGSSTVVVFDVSGGAGVVPTVIADFPTGASPDFDGPSGVGPCIASWNGGAGSAPECADDRSDEMAYGTVSGHNILAVINGDPGLPFVTLVDVTDIVGRNYAKPIVPAGLGICAPVTPDANYNPGLPTAPPSGTNYPNCILGQIYYDGVGQESASVQVDDAGGPSGTPCPDMSENVASGVSGTGVGIAGNAVGGNGTGSVNVPCHHGPIVNVNTGFFITNTGTAGANQLGEIAPAGLGALAFNPIHNTFYLENSNCTVSNLATQSSVAVGCIDEIDPRIGNIDGPEVINVVPVLNCMPAGLVQGPGSDFFVGCGGHDGTQFPPELIIYNGSTTTSATAFASETIITQSGGTDEVWYNPGDKRYYTAGRDMPTGPVMGVVDAISRLWLVNVPTNSNSHSVAVDQFTNHAFVPSQAGNICTTQSSNGCILVIAQQ